MTNKQKKGKEINIFKSLARSNVSSTKSEEQEVNLVWPILCINTSVTIFGNNQKHNTHFVTR
jgi:hypothetical protein